MTLTAELANRMYSIMVATIGSPDDYRRWSFCHAVSVVHVHSYAIDSLLGIGARLHLTPLPPVLTVKDVTPVREAMVHRANTALAKVIPIQVIEKCTAIPVHRVNRADNENLATAEAS